MTNFEDKIRDKKALFDHKEPKKEHLARFIFKLEEDQVKQSRKRSPFFFLKVAAIFILMVTVGFLTIDYLIREKDHTKQAQLIVYSSGLNEVMTYYDDKSSAKMNKLESITSENPEARKIRQTAYNRLEDIDISLASIEKEYLKNPENEMLKAALINNKRKKVEVMDRILMQMDIANSQLY